MPRVTPRSAPARATKTAQRPQPAYRPGPYAHNGDSQVPGAWDPVHLEAQGCWGDVAWPPLEPCQCGKVGTPVRAAVITDTPAGPAAPLPPWPRPLHSCPAAASQRDLLWNSGLRRSTEGPQVPCPALGWPCQRRGHRGRQPAPTGFRAHGPATPNSDFGPPGGERGSVVRQAPFAAAPETMTVCTAGVSPPPPASL